MCTTVTVCRVCVGSLSLFFFNSCTYYSNVGDTDSHESALVGRVAHAAPQLPVRRQPLLRLLGCHRSDARRQRPEIAASQVELLQPSSAHSPSGSAVSSTLSMLRSSVFRPGRGKYASRPIPSGKTIGPSPSSPPPPPDLRHSTPFDGHRGPVGACPPRLACAAACPRAGGPPAAPESAHRLVFVLSLFPSAFIVLYIALLQTLLDYSICSSEYMYSRYRSALH